MKRILLVEDQMDFQMMAKNCLGDQYLIRVAKTLSEAKDYLAVEEFDLILMDVMLPDGSGFEMVRRIKEDHLLRQIPVIFLTSKSGIEERVEGLRLGAEDFIVKPYQCREFTARIESQIRLLSGR